MLRAPACSSRVDPMDPSHLEQMQRLSKYRNAVKKRQPRRQRPTSKHLSSDSSSESILSSSSESSHSYAMSSASYAPEDPLIYPGLYSPSGFDMMSILMRVATRPNPIIQIGAVDSSCALVVVDVHAPDMPLVYVSEAFELLTGYRSPEILGRNCRFLQSPNGVVLPGSKRKHVDNHTIHDLQENVRHHREVQTSLVNFKKDGTRFHNLLTLIPVCWDTPDVRYMVGFQVDLKGTFL